MTRRPKPTDREPPWMRLGPAADGPDEGDDGERLWKKIAEGVKPLKETKHKRQAPPPPAEGELKRPTAAPRARAQTEGAASGPAPRLNFKGGATKEGPPPLVPGQLAGLDRRSGEKLRKGQMPVEAKLDLHGMTQEGAHASVARFIEGQHAAGARCVLIVTGKGGKSAGPFGAG